MKKYSEFGYGNTWCLRTEFEKDDGSEWEVKGISGSIRLESVYLRMRLGQRVYILDLRDGFKRQKKNRKAIQFIFEIRSDRI